MCVCVFLETLLRLTKSKRTAYIKKYEDIIKSALLPICSISVCSIIEVKKPKLYRYIIFGLSHISQVMHWIFYTPCFNKLLLFKWSFCSIQPHPNTTIANLESPIKKNPYMSLDCERIPEKLHTERAWPGFEHRTFLLWGNSANHWTKIPVTELQCHNVYLFPDFFSYLFE